MGLYQGMPNKIPVVEEDFIFSAIAEEMGGIFAICLVLICMSCFIMFINISMQIKNNFYKYTALGFGTLYGFQVFLTIGGAIRFIPSTGVTLPLVSYGGSSIVSSIVMFAVIQGMYLLKEDEELKIEKERERAARERAKARKAKKEGTAPEGRRRKAEPQQRRPAAGAAGKKKNHELAVVTYMFIGLFTLMIGYFVYFETVLREDVINNPYNSRQDAFAEKVVRGSILADDGTVLAETEVSDDGTETRVYPYANVFAHVVGYSTRGRTGIENLANFGLLTSDISTVEQIRNSINERKDQGNNVVTTLNVELQQTAYSALGNSRGRSGSAGGRDGQGAGYGVKAGF